LQRQWKKSIANKTFTGKGKHLARIHCFNCQNTWEYEGPLPRGEECPSCHSDAKVCLNCHFYDPQAYRECREPQAGWVKEKDRSNFCSYFTPCEKREDRKSKEDDLKSKLDQLFKK